MNHKPVATVSPMENNQPSTSEPSTSEPKTPDPESYFDYQQYIHRLFNEYEWNNQNSDASSDSDGSNETLIQSISSYCDEAEKSPTPTKKTLSVIQRKTIQKQRKACLVRKLRKKLLPQNATTVLYDMLGHENVEFNIIRHGTAMKAEVVVNNVKYEAVERSKALAKKTVSENALRGMVIAQMANVDGTPKNRNEAALVLPMEHLARYALHKLFTEWQVNGFEGDEKKDEIQPFFCPAAPVIIDRTKVEKLPKVAKTVADLPPDASTMHPSLLFAYMRPQVAFDDLGYAGNHLEWVYVAGIRTDGSCFFGKGYSKKDARKAAAASACKVLFGVVFEESVVAQEKQT
uniref:DRBM domain-containing protein n=1 Tax=Anopheles culicifacies TaxID=139723 RepID=A0A182M115_9DIPT